MVNIRFRRIIIFSHLSIIFTLFQTVFRHLYQFLSRNKVYLRPVRTGSRRLIGCWNIWWRGASVFVSRGRQPSECCKTSMHFLQCVLTAIAYIGRPVYLGVLGSDVACSCFAGRSRRIYADVCVDVETTHSLFSPHTCVKIYVSNCFFPHFFPCL